MKVPAPLPYGQIRERLLAIFPEGTPNRNNCTWEIAARTVFVMLYVGAIEGENVWIRPDQVTRMTDAQVAKRSDAERADWYANSLRPSKEDVPGRWYAVNTRESIRDDTLRAGFIANGVVIEREGLPTTSPAPKYALKISFAALFDPGLQGAKLEQRIHSWQASNLNAAALARVAMVRSGLAAGGDHVMVRFPNGETRRMAPGPSSHLSRAVIEDFAPRYLREPTVVLLSESRNKVVARDERLLRDIRLQVETQKHLPDVVLADLGTEELLLVFVEVVASDGPITTERKAALAKVADEGGFRLKNLAFVTVYLDRSQPAFKRTIDDLAWGSFVWLASEPSHLIYLADSSHRKAKTLDDWL